jgi:type IV secretion system protein VirD4
MFADLALWRKATFCILLLVTLPLLLPFASFLASFVFLYEYDHVLVYSMLIHKVDPLYALTAIAAALTLWALMAAGFLRLVSPKNSIYGDARLARTHEIRKKGLLDVSGTSIVLGRVGKKLAAFNDDLHVFLAAMTGSGKGVSFVIPNLLNWSDSVVCVDIKRDLHRVTSWFRSQVLGQQVYVFEPLSKNTDAFNPLSYLPEDSDLQIDELQRIAASLCPIDDPYFDGQARVLFVGLMQMLIEAHEHLRYQCSIGQVLKLLGTEMEIGEFLRLTVRKLDEEGHPLSARCKSNLFSFINEPEKPRGSIRSSLVNHLQLWTNPRIDRATSHSTFDFATFRKTPQTLYLVAGPNDMDRLGPLFRLLFDSFLAVNTRPGEQPSDQPEVYKHQVLLMLDEFISLGVMNNLVHALSYVRGWGIKVATVIQSTSQLTTKYDNAGAEAFEDGHRARIFFRPSRTSKTASTDLADTLGRYTGKSGSVTRPSFLSSGGNRTVSTSETDLYLFTPDQIRNMPDHRCFLMVDGLRPIYANKVVYFEDRHFKHLVNDPVPLPPPLQRGESVYPGAQSLAPDEVIPVLRDAIRNEIDSIEVPDDMTADDIEAIADQLCAVLENA